MAKASIKTNVKKCRKYRNKMEQDPKCQEQMREKNRNRMQKTRRKHQTVEQLEHTRKLARERQQVYDARKRQERQGVAAKGTAREKVEKKREKWRQASQNYRDGITAQKKRRVKEKRMSQKYKKKEAKMAAEVAKVEKAVQAQAAFQQSGCPYPTQGAYKRATRRQTHVGSLSKKRDVNTLKHKRRLAQAFKDCGEIEKVGINKRFSLTLGEHSPYKRRGIGFQTALTDFFHKNSCPDPCKSTKKRQLTKSVKELHKKHVFNAEWQRKQLQSLKAKLPEGWVIVTCDFAANFLCKFQDEPQSAHWGYSQWKIVKMKNPGPGSFLPEMNPTLPHEKGDETLVTSSSNDESDEESHVIPDSDSEKESAIISSSESDLGVEEECVIVKVESMSVEEESDRVVEEESDGVEDTSAGLEEHEDNKTFFRKLSTELTSCASFSEVQEKARFWQQHAEDIKIPDSSNENPALGCRIDSQAATLLPSDLQGRCFPLSVYGDGNCFFRALSLLLYGTQDHHQEMRVRVVMAMALNPKLFLDGNNWRREFHNVTGEEIIKVAVLTSAEPASSSPFEDEVMAMRKNGTYAGLWEFFAASHVLKRPIQSVFPPLGWDIYRLHCHRIIKAPCCKSSSKLIIMWTSLRDVINEEHWTPNHFVPLVPRFQ
ncbi:uncharacterized protein [Littorina saxatilis]|uniref:uncharacterized protein n=1 Tax=Littorina saxatilis TaxID=31220 RepID=UPI0038B663CB